MSQPQQPTAEQLEAMQREMEIVANAFGVDPLLRITQQALFIANRMGLLAMMVMRHRLTACGVERPDIAIRAMLRDQDLINSSIGPMDVAKLQGQIETNLLPYFELLAEAKVTLADLESNDNQPAA